MALFMGISTWCVSSVGLIGHAMGHSHAMRDINVRAIRALQHASEGVGVQTLGWDPYAI